MPQSLRLPVLTSSAADHYYCPLHLRFGGWDSWDDFCFFRVFRGKQAVLLPLPVLIPCPMSGVFWSVGHGTAGILDGGFWILE